jgi:protease II
MGFSRKEVYYWLESTSDDDLQRTLNSSKDMLSLLTDREQMTSLKWLREQIIEEINARKEAKQS